MATDFDALFEVQNWFADNVGLPQYFSRFESKGYISLEKIMKIDNKKILNDIGVHLLQDQNKIINAISKLNGYKNKEKEKGIIKPIKILLLGCKSSGKTTIFNAMSWKYSLKYQIDTNSMIDHIRKQLIQSMLILCEMAQCFNKNYYKLKENKNIINIELKLIGNIISNLWNNQCIQRVFLCRYMIKYKIYNDKLMHNLSYFLNDIDRIFDPDTAHNIYNSKDNDYYAYKFKINSIGVQEIEYLDPKYNKFQLIDVGYNEINNNNNNNNNDLFNKYNFDNIDGIIFTIAVSDFCVFNVKQNKNALKYAIEYFQKIIKMDRFKLTTIQIIFTKKDLFYENIKNGYSLSTCFDHELYTKYVNNNKINCFPVWDTKKDYNGNVKIFSHLIPGFIRTFIKLNIISIKIIDSISKYMPNLDEILKNKEDDKQLEKRKKSICIKANNFIDEGFSKLIQLGLRKKLIFCAPIICDTSDREKIIGLMEYAQQNILRGIDIIKNKIGYKNGNYFDKTTKKKKKVNLFAISEDKEEEEEEDEKYRNKLLKRSLSAEEKKSDDRNDNDIARGAQLRALKAKYSSVRVILPEKDKNRTPRCFECGGFYHIQSDPISAYDGVGIVCEICGKNRADNPELLLENHYYKCENCGMIDICSKCYQIEKKKVIKLSTMNLFAAQKKLK